jgi:hypothetical protein
MVTDASEESGLEELIRLSREIGNMEKVLVEDLGNARKKKERVEKQQTLWSIIRDIKISLVLDKLKPLEVAPEIIDAVSELREQLSTEKVRQLTLGLLGELKNSVDGGKDANLDLAEICRLVKTVSILVEFLFYID